MLNVHRAERADRLADALAEVLARPLPDPIGTPDILLVDSPSQLEREIGVVRRHVLRVYDDAHAHVQGWVSRWIGVEHAVESTSPSPAHAPFF